MTLTQQAAMKRIRSIIQTAVELRDCISMDAPNLDFAFDCISDVERDLSQVTKYFEAMVK